jgi:hypothetical protein
MCRHLNEKRIPCTLIVDGSYLTEEIDPGDIDFAVCVTPSFYESCSETQLSYLDWIRDSREPKLIYSCDCYLCVEYPNDHPEWFEGIQERSYWVNLFATSVVYKRVRGVASIEIGIRT